jgi:2-aminoethylphosphonate-pyruvate transaminase
MQGSGTFSVESVIGSSIPEDGHLLVLANGAYGYRIAQIARKLKINHTILKSSETKPPDIDKLESILQHNSEITHLALVHCETTTGILNPLDEIAKLTKKYEKVLIVDAMSSFGGIPIDVENLGIDYLVSSANKCIQGVPGFGFIIGKIDSIANCKDIARSHALDLYDQWETMEQGNGKWRFTSPTHVVRAFSQALDELEAEGGIEKRFIRYATNQRILVSGMRNLGFTTLLPDTFQSPIITSFIAPGWPNYNFTNFYNRLKEKGFVIYPGKISDTETFRVGNIGEVYNNDIKHFLEAVEEIF